MPWYFPWSDSIKKRACRYLLQHYLGQFLQEKLTLDQLSVDLYNGTGTIRNLNLDVWALNEFLENSHVPVEIVDGYVSKINVGIPWSALNSDSTTMEIHGLELTLQPKERKSDSEAPVDPSIMLDSWNMTSSLQLAQECLKQEPSEGEQQAEGAQPFEGLEMFAQTIESVLSRIKVSFLDTVIRIEHLPKEAKMGVALEMRIKRIDYFDDQATDHGSPVDKMTPDMRNIYEPAAIQNKNFHLMGVAFFCDQFPESNRTFSRNTSVAASLESSPLSPKSCTPILTQPNPALSHSSTALSEPIKIGELSGQQEVKVKLKQSEALPGPKLEVNCNLTVLKVLLSPKQVHILLQLISGLSSPGTCDNTNVKPRSASNKPMQPDDYRRVEQELQTQLQNTHVQYQQPSSSLKHHLWQDDPLEMLGESFEEDVYFSMGLGGAGPPSEMDTSISSQHSTVSTKSTSTVGSSNYQYSYGGGYRAKLESPFKATIPKGAMNRKQGRMKSKDCLQKLLDDPAAELTRYKLKLTYLSITILHEDPPPTPSDGIDPGVASIEKLKNMSEAFFTDLRCVPDRTTSMDLTSLREKYAAACPHDHLNFIAKPLTVECNQKSSSAFHTMSADISLAMMEVIETLFDRRSFTSSSPLGFGLPVDHSTPYFSEILVFIRDAAETKTHDYPSLQAVQSPCVKIRINNYEKNKLVVSRSSSQLPRTEVHVELAPFKSEVDFTIIDRINPLLNPEPLVKVNDPNGARYWSVNPNMNVNKQSYFSQAIEEGNSTVDRKVDVHVTSSMAILQVRFPIPDLRTGLVGDKFPWWKRTLRNEVLIIELSDTDLHTGFNTSDIVHTFELTSRDLHGLFQENPDEAPISFIRVSQGSNDECSTADNQDGFDWPRIVLKKMPPTQSSLMDPDIYNDDIPQPDSMDSFCQFSKPDPSPFSSKKSHYEEEEMVMPGDRQEMNDFQEKSVANTLTSIEITAPNVNLLLPSKEFYELIYNRINGDLLMWEPQAPSPITTQEQFAYSMPPPVGLLDPYSDFGQEKFNMCRSGYAVDSSSDSEESSSQFYTIHDQKERQKRNKRQEQQLRPSQICVTFAIGQGKLTACLPLKNEAGEVLKDTCGEFVMEVRDGEIFCVVGHNGNPDLQYVCIHSNKAQIYHAGEILTPTSWPIIDRASPVSTFMTELRPTVYKSEPGVHTKLSGSVGTGGDSLDMVSIAVKITLDTFSNVKEFLVAVGIRGSTLQHQITTSNKSWLNQVMDFLDVKDYPILGYTMPKIVTVLHAHFWSCAIDYRPLYLPLRSMVTVEHFSISSNIIAASDTSLLRFIVDDAALFLSDKTSNGVDLKKNYVCVLDVGLFELSLITSDGKDTKYPRVDLKASNNIIHIRTCADSCRALQQLIQYVAGDSDLDTEETDTRSVQTEPPSMSKPPESLRSVPMTESKMEEVHDMMADAMRESSGSSSPESHEDKDGRQRRDSGTEVFFFPDDSRPAGSTPPMRHTDLIEESRESMSSSTITNDTDQCSDDEEFCIIDDPGLGIAPRDGEPVVRVLTDEPLLIKDNHFCLPLGKTDQLKAPENFPPALYRYTLKEMSVVWHMYGGSDFAPGVHEKKDKYSKITVYGSRVSYGKATKESKSAKMPWQHRGGPERDHKVLMELQMNKVRLQHEVYPETTEQAARQIFLVHEVEIRDRLATSQINKFLYHYTSESMPKQSHAHMIMAKALHMRTDLKLPNQKECSLKVSLLPLRLNIDQDSLFFLKDFFNEVSGGESRHHISVHCPPPPEVSTSPAKPSSLPPVMSLGSSSPEETEPDPQQMLIVFDELAEAAEDKEAELDASESASPLPPVFFKSFVFSPDVLIRLDYQGKRVDMGQGTAAGLLIGLAQLNCSELKLKRISHRHGLLGVDRLVLYAFNEWITDITKNQIPNILSGVGPMHSFVQLVQGIRDLFWLPVEQYRKDGRIIRGIQRGARSFTTSTVMATLELTNRMVQSVQYVAELAYDMVSPGPSVRRLGKKPYRRHKRISQPADFREGISNAYTVVKEGIAGTAENIVRVAQDEHELKGVTGAVGGVLRQIPPTIVQPLILASEATSNVLGGMRNQLLPDARREEEEKWKPDS